MRTLVPLLVFLFQATIADVSFSREFEEFETRLVETWNDQLQRAEQKACLTVRVRERTGSAEELDSGTLESFLREAPALTHQYCVVDDRALLRFEQPRGRALVHLVNPNYFAAVEGEGKPNESLMDARMVRCLVRNPAMPNGENVEADLAQSALASMRQMSMLSASFSGVDFGSLIQQEAITVTAHEPKPAEGLTVITFDVLDPKSFEKTAMQDVRRFHMTSIDSLGLAPASIDAVEFTNERTIGVRLYWNQRRNDAGNVFPESFGHVWRLESGRVTAFDSEVVDFDPAPDLRAGDFTLSSFNLPEPPEPRAPGAYRTPPWLYYFFGGVLCVAIGAFFVHRSTRGRRAR